MESINNWFLVFNNSASNLIDFNGMAESKCSKQGQQTGCFMLHGFKMKRRCNDNITLKKIVPCMCQVKYLYWFIYPCNYSLWIVSHWMLISKLSGLRDNPSLYVVKHDVEQLKSQHVQVLLLQKVRWKPKYLSAMSIQRKRSFIENKLSMQTFAGVQQ